MTVANFIPEIWAAALLENQHAAQVVTPTLNRQYEGEARKGNVVKITAITTPNVQNYGTSRTLTIEDLSDTGQDLPINQEKAIAFKVDDVDRVQAAGSFEPVTTDAGQALAEDAESYVLAQMTANGTAVGTAALADGNAAFNAVNSIRESLGKAKVPAGNRYLAVNPAFASLLLGAESKLTSVGDAGSDGELRNGVLGRLLGFTVLETPLLDNGGRPAAIGYHGPSVAFVGQIDKVESGRMEKAFADYVRALQVYGAKVLRPTSVQTYLVAAGA